jgi:ABC-2 type transport system permease protein
MSQVMATALRIMKELMREKVTIFWTIAFPVLWLCMYSVIFLNGVPAEIKGTVMGATVISMAVYGLMVAGSVDLPGNIATDRASGVLAKLRSMPVKPRSDFAGRLIAFTAFGMIAVSVVAVIGHFLGAQVPLTVAGAAGAVAFFGLAFMAASGIGMVIASLVLKESSATMTGIVLTLVGGFVSGIFVSFRALPVFLQGFAQLYPLSASTSSIVYLLFGEHYAGYNPLTWELLAVNVALSLGLFAVGQYLYAKRVWRAR